MHMVMSKRCGPITIDPMLSQLGRHSRPMPALVMGWSSSLVAAIAERGSLVANHRRRASS